MFPSVYFLRAHGKSNPYVSTFLLVTTYAITLIMSHYFKQLSPNDPNWWVVVAETVVWWMVVSGGVWVVGWQSAFF